jgi:hypothetical protein
MPIYKVFPLDISHFCIFIYFYPNSNFITNNFFLIEILFIDFKKEVPFIDYFLALLENLYMRIFCIRFVNLNYYFRIIPHNLKSHLVIDLDFILIFQTPLI